MTDKRYFALIGEDGYVYPVFFDSENEDKEIDVDVVVDLLNENEQLRHDATILIQSNQDYRKENEQLKQFKEDVFNKIDMHLRMLPTARDNEFDEDDGDPSLYVGAIYMLETLKKELEE